METQGSTTDTGCGAVGVGCRTSTPGWGPAGLGWGATMGLVPWARVGLASVTRGLGWLLAWACWGAEGLWWAAGLDWAWGLCFWAMGLCFSEVGAEWGPLPSVRARDDSGAGRGTNTGLRCNKRLGQ